MRFLSISRSEIDTSIGRQIYIISIFWFDLNWFCFFNSQVDDLLTVARADGSSEVNSDCCCCCCKLGSLGKV